MAVLDILKSIWDFFATYVLQKAPYMVGFLTLLGYTLMGKKWYDTLGGTLKAIIGMLILNAGSGGLTSTFRPILAGLKDRFNLSACVIDPYYGQNAVQEAMESIGKTFADTMMLLLIAFIINIDVPVFRGNPSGGPLCPAKYGLIPGVCALIGPVWPRDRPGDCPGQAVPQSSGSVGAVRHTADFVGHQDHRPAAGGPDAAGGTSESGEGAVAQPHSRAEVALCAEYSDHADAVPDGTLQYAG